MNPRRVSDLVQAQAIPNSVFDLARVQLHADLTAQLRARLPSVKGRLGATDVDALPMSLRRLARRAYRNLTSCGTFCGPRWCNNKSRF
jgi:hypothetical protein